MEVITILKLDLDHPELRRIYHKTFHSLNDFLSEVEFSQEIDKIIDYIKEIVFSFINLKEIIP